MLQTQNTEIKYIEAFFLLLNANTPNPAKDKHLDVKNILAFFCLCKKSCLKPNTFKILFRV
jgi:hypothetical protein